MTAVDEQMERWPLSTTIARGGIEMLAAAFTAPLIGVRKRWPYVLHDGGNPSFVAARRRANPVASGGVWRQGPSSVWPGR